MQSAWSFSFTGEPHDALAATSEIGGILPKELVSLQELINVFSECVPVATETQVEATETIGSKVIIKQSVRFNSVPPGGNISFTPKTGKPADIKTLVGEQTNIEQWLRWSARNACDQVMLTGATSMTLSISQKVISKGQSVCTVNYSF